METVVATVMWTGAEAGVLSVLEEPPARFFEARLIDSGDAVFVELDGEDGEETGNVVGVEILSFLDFQEWEAVPRLEKLWRVGNGKPLPLGELLKEKQAELREKAGATA